MTADDVNNMPRSSHNITQWFKSRTLGMGMMNFFFCISIVVTD